MQFNEIRQKYPEYSDMSDEDFANKFHKKFYSDMDFSSFASRVGYTKEQPEQSGYANFVNSLPRPVQGAIGGFEALGSMALSTPSMIEGFGRKVYSHLTSEGTEEEKRQKALEAASNTFIPSVHAKSEMGKVGEELLGLIPQKVIEGAGNLGAEFVRGQTFLNDPTLKNTGQVEQKHGKEGIEAGRTFGELLAEGAMLEPIVSGGIKAVKNFNKPKELSPEIKAIQEEIQKQVEEQAKQVSKTETKLPEEITTHGAQLDLFRETPEEIVARQREQAKAEAEGILRDAQGEQGDLFLGQGKEPVESIIPKDSKPAEIDAAWAAREAEQKRLFDEDAQRFAVQQEPLTLEPSQGSSLLEKFSNDRTTNRPSPNAGKFGQGGAVDWEVFTSWYPEFKKSIMEGIPLFHGTKNEITGSIKKSSDGGALGNGVYLTPNPKFASDYANGPKGNVHQVYANIEKPLVLEGKHADPMVEALMALGLPEKLAVSKVERAYDSKGYITSEVENLAHK